jgi:hypothetical protein
MGSVLRTGLSLAGVGALVISCVAPTLPLPPPVAIGFDESGFPASQKTLGQVTLSSTDAEPNAIIVTYNTDSNVPHDERVGGAQADENGSWSATIFAFHGDYVEVTQEIVLDPCSSSCLETSPPTQVTVP